MSKGWYFKAADRARRLRYQHLHPPIEPDNRILECVIAAQAEFVVSGDRHLLALKQHANITMISLADFLTKLPR
jgi:predicted nucleic acid-binding protein